MFALEVRSATDDECAADDPLKFCPGHDWRISGVVDTEFGFMGEDAGRPGVERGVENDSCVLAAPLVGEANVEWVCGKPA
ncbi:MAG: hypothetical protein ACXWC8_19705, partial [Limisphaerales bacterium]